MELVNSSIPRITMKAAIKLGVLEILAKASPSQLTSSEIASQLPTNNKEAPIVLDRMLRLLACHSFRNLVTNKDGSVQRLYGLASVSRFFVPNEDGVSLAPCLLLDHDPPPPLLLDHDPSLPRLLDHELSPMIFQVMTQVRSALDVNLFSDCVLMEGTVPFMRAHNGLHLFDYASKDARLQNLFNQSMHNHTAIGFEELNELVDVAGGLGVNMSLIVNTYSQIRGINFDLPHVIENASSSPVSRNISTIDVVMYNLFPGAKERTMEEFNALAIGAGFGTIKVICRAYCYWVIEFYKTIHIMDCIYLTMLPMMLNLFNQSMQNHTAIVMKKILEIYKGFKELKKLVDVASCLGANMSLIVNTYPQITGVEHVEGDMFVNVPSGQAIFTKSVLLNWSDEQCLKILKNCYDALPKSRKHGNILTLDIVMYDLFPQAKGRTAGEFKALAMAAGFGTIKVICRAYCYWLTILPLVLAETCNSALQTFGKKALIKNPKISSNGHIDISMQSGGGYVWAP
ncbi:hypothetical protein CUMW_237030, partial [Citrus unshiu]